MTYMDMPLGDHYKAPLIWNTILEKIGEEAFWVEMFIPV